MTTAAARIGKAVSVIIPTYNRSALLVEAVESVLAQTYPAHEIIIVDDRSDDPHRQKLDALADRSPLIRVHRLAAHGERSRARNAGLALASGDFVLFLDDDDLLEAGMIAAALRGFAAVASVDVVVGRGQRFGDLSRAFAVPLNPFWADSAGDPESWVSTLMGVSAVPGRDLERHPVRMLLKNQPPINAFVVRREAIGTTRFPEDLHLGEDRLFWLELAAKGCRFSSNPDGRAYVRLHSHNFFHSRPRPAIVACERLASRVRVLGREEAFLATAVWARACWLARHPDWWRPACRLLWYPNLLFRYGGQLLARRVYRRWSGASAALQAGRESAASGLPAPAPEQELQQRDRRRIA